MNTFTANGKTYITDDHTLELLREFRAANNEKMVEFMFLAGLASGRIEEAA